MTHYQMSYPTWHLTQSVLNLLHYRSDLFLFQSYQASPKPLNDVIDDIFLRKKDINIHRRRHYKQFE